MSPSMPGIMIRLIVLISFIPSLMKGGDELGASNACGARLAIANQGLAN